MGDTTKVACAIHASIRREEGLFSCVSFSTSAIVILDGGRSKLIEALVGSRIESSINALID